MGFSLREIVRVFSLEKKIFSGIFLETKNKKILQKTKTSFRWVKKKKKFESIFYWNSFLVEVILSRKASKQDSERRRIFFVDGSEKKLQKLFFSLSFYYIFSLCFSIADFAVLSHRKTHFGFGEVKKNIKRRQRNERMNLHSIQEWELLRNSPELGDASKKPVFGFIIALFAFLLPTLSLKFQTQSSSFSFPLTFSEDVKQKVNKNILLFGWLFVCLYVWGSLNCTEQEWNFSLLLWKPPTDWDSSFPQNSLLLQRRF